MSSDSSGPSKSNKNEKQKSIPKSRKLQSSEESDDRLTSQGSKESQKTIKSTPKSKIKVLEQLGYSTAVVDLYHTEEPQKRTATTHNSTAPTVITAVLRDLQDDVVRSPNYRQPGPVSLINGERAIAVIGGDNIYVQNKTKFIPVPREKALSSHHNPHFWTLQSSKLQENSPLDVAILLQKVFMPISSICFGLLGGVALLQLILVNHLVKGMTDQDRNFFLQSYSTFAELTPLLFYILLAVCVVSVLDRISVQKETIVCQPWWIVIAVYAFTLILTLSCTSYDDMIVLYSQNKTLFQNEMKTQELVSEWQLLNTLRCFFAILGWVLYSLTTPPDLMLEHLLHMKQYEHDQQSTPSLIRNSVH